MKITSVVHTAFALALLLLAIPAVPAALAAPAAATADVQVAPPSDSQTTPPVSAPPRREDETYSADEIVQKAAGFFGATTEAVAKAVEQTFTLVYNLPNPEAIYERFPGIEGSAYFIAGIGVNYQQSGRVVLAPMRTGVGLRAGVNGGYLSYAKERNWIPF